jgi:hypothetical protein
MIVLSFKSKRDKEHLLEKAKKMEEYASMIVECIEESKDEDYEYEEGAYKERAYREDRWDEPERMNGRYGYGRMR